MTTKVHYFSFEMAQTSFLAGASPRTLLRKSTTFPRFPIGFTLPPLSPISTPSLYEIMLHKFSIEIINITQLQVGGNAPDLTPNVAPALIPAGASPHTLIAPQNKNTAYATGHHVVVVVGLVELKVPLSTRHV